MARESVATADHVEPTLEDPADVFESYTLERNHFGLYFIKNPNMPDCLKGQFTTRERAKAAVRNYLDTKKPAHVNPIKDLFNDVPNKPQRSGA